MKTYRSSIYCVPADEEPVWSEGAPHYGWQRVTDAPIPPEVTGTTDSWHVIHCAPGTEPPDNVAAIVVKGHDTPWTADAVALGWPNGHPYVMDATWPAQIDGKEYQIRGKMIDIPEGVEPIETLLVPHEWAGDGEETP